MVAFTLVETLVVVTLIAVMAALIVPRMGRSLGRRELRECAGRLAHTMRTVRQLAVAQQRTMAIAFAENRSGYYATVPSGQTGSGSAVRLSWLKPTRWPEGVKLVGLKIPRVRAGAGTRDVKFFSDGTSSGASIRLACGEDEYALVIYPHNGAVRCGDSRTASFPESRYDLGD